MFTDDETVVVANDAAAAHSVSPPTRRDVTRVRDALEGTRPRPTSTNEITDARIHAWIGLSESDEESDLGQLEGKVAELQELVADSRWHDAVFEVRNLNGGHFFSATGFVNRPREEGDRLDLFLAIITRRLPGSYGLIYDRRDTREL